MTDPFWGDERAWLTVDRLVRIMLWVFWIVVGIGIFVIAATV